MSTSPRLVAVAGWDAEGVRTAAGVLAAVADGVPSWRSRVDLVGRRVAEGEGWAGPAASAAARGALVVSHVASAVGAATAESLVALRQLADETAAARLLARAAQSAADAGAPAAAGLAQDALVHAERAGLAAARAGEALAGPAPGSGAVPGFAGLTGAVLPAALPGASPSGPGAAARWWAGLPAPAQRALVQQRPGLVGALDGVPAWARDRANRLLLARALRRPHPSPTARAVAGVLAASETGAGPVRLLLIDEPGERVVLSLGDPDTADAVALLVPGIATTPADDLHRVVGSAARTRRAAAAAGAGTVAAVAWLGYRPPVGAGILGRRRAVEAGPLLDDALDGLAASRRAAGASPARTTVLAHSYGTVVLDEAADAPGRLAADAVVLLGSPGLEGTATDLEAAEVYDAAAPCDPVSWVGWFGSSSWHPDFGSVGLPVGDGTGHSGYYGEGGPTLEAIGAVVATGWRG